MAIINGKIHYKWSFSIAMLNCQRVDHFWSIESHGENLGPPETKKLRRGEGGVFAGNYGKLEYSIEREKELYNQQ